MLKILLGGLLAGIVVFFWGFVAHMLLPLGEMGLQSIPNEDALTAAMKKDVGEPGLYFVPGRDMSKSQSTEEMEAYAAKISKGPYGFMVIYPNGRDVSLGKRLPIEFGTNVVCALSGRDSRLAASPGLPRARGVCNTCGHSGVHHDPCAVLELVWVPDRLHACPDPRKHRGVVLGGLGARGNCALIAAGKAWHLRNVFSCAKGSRILNLLSVPLFGQE